MRPRQRQARIAEIIWHKGQMSVDALAHTFDVSVETIRRDLGQLAEGGLLQKVHGGAKRLRLHAEGSFQERMAENAQAKRTIAAKMLRLVEPGDTVFIDTGSTTLACAEALSGVERLTVITNSVAIAQVFGASQAGTTVYLLGGAYGNDNGQTVGPLVLDQIQEFQADHAILTVAAIDPAVGAMDSNFDEAQVARAMIGHARNVFVAANLTKFGRKAAFRVCRLEEVDVVVTDGAPDQAHATALAAAGVEIR
ncbi:DeoR/GlpR family DNA-binding transcription regulator [Chthonobacter albigriseus]|uniref:DeoR/GlpR family DNA-binding transcription regulator n=1 Tax=Chthonobacter albigriseus TaxID=1683161 RepID=UPI0015EE61E8|nr:DeoR/GlpR family DNA-binding transcription regulator [Chthonobacter albigriseus]